MTNEVPAKFIDISGKSSNATALIVDLATGERLKRSLLRGGAFFGAAVVSVFIPILHFVLVPTFLIIAFVLFGMTISQSKIVPLIKGPCPACDHPIEFANHKYAATNKDVCPNCRQLLTIELPA